MSGPSQLAQTSPQNPPMSVLVVDDEEGMREGIRRILERHGYAVLTAENGRQAIARLEERSFDLALIDLKMPGVDGFQLTKHISDTCGERTVVVIVSAFATVEAAVEAMKHGAFDFLVKPFTPADLMQVVARASYQRRLISERDVYLSELNSEQNLSRQLTNTMREGLVILNTERKPVLMNPRAESILGVRYRDDLQLETMCLGREADSIIDRMLTGALRDSEILPVRLERSGRTVELHIARYTRGADLAGLMLFLRDPTDV